MCDAHTYETSVDVRYRDLDTFGHVNNAAVLTLCEEAHLDYAHDILDVSDPAFVVAHIEVDYLQPITDPGPVTISIEVTNVGESSFTLACDIARDGKTAVTTETVLVVVNERGASRALPDEWRAAMDPSGR